MHGSGKRGRTAPIILAQLNIEDNFSSMNISKPLVKLDIHQKMSKELDVLGREGSRLEFGSFTRCWPKQPSELYANGSKESSGHDTA